MQVVDVSTPVSPQTVGNVNTPGSPLGVCVAGSHAFVADGPSGLQVIDISNPTAPQLVGAFSMPGS
jgi:hypothetical protein